MFMRLLAAALFAISMAAGFSQSAWSAEQGIVAIVNDVPVTEHDITQRILLLRIVRDDGRETLTRKQALMSLIDEQIKISEAKKFKMMPTDKEIAEQVSRMSKGMNLTADSLLAKLKSQGISAATFNRYVGALIGFNRIMTGKYRNDVNVTEQDVDNKLAEIKKMAGARLDEIMRDPRMKPITVYSLLEINLPVEDNDPMLMQSRAIEAAEVAKRFKGCDNARAAAEGVFNVKIGKRFEADGAKLPKPMRAVLDKVGAGHAIGPMRGKTGIQLIGFCGVRKVTPPKPDFKMPTRQQVERSLINDKYDALEEDYLKSMRSTVYVEYRDNTYAQQ